MSLAESTINVYNHSLRKVKELLSVKDDKEFLKYRKYIKKVLEIQDIRLSTKKGYLAAISHMIKNNYNNDKIVTEYNKAVKKLSEIINDEKDDNKLVNRENERYIEWDDILKLRDSIKKDDYNGYLKYLILCLYTMTPPRRSKDYALMKIVKSTKEAKDDNYNYLILNSKGGTFIFNQYKTKNSYGSQEINVPSDLLKVIKYWIKNYNINGEWLLVNLQGNNYSDNALTKYIISFMEKLTGKRFGVGMFRVSYVTHLNKSLGSMMSLNRRKKEAKGMAHSVSTSLKYIRI